MREGRQRKMDGRGVNGEEMTIQQEEEEEREGRRRREREGRRREKEEKRKKSRLRAEEESIWKEVGESLTSKAQAGAVKSKNSREVKRVQVRSREERREPNTRTQTSKDKTRSENLENSSPRKPKEASRNVKYKIDPKEAEAGDGRSAVSRLFSTKRSRKGKTKEEELGSRRGKREEIGRGRGFREETEGGKVRESRRRREKSELRGEIGEERAKKIDGRRSLTKWLVGRLGRESLAESLSRGHVCRVRR